MDVGFFAEREGLVEQRNSGDPADWLVGRSGTGNVNNDEAVSHSVELEEVVGRNLCIGRNLYARSGGQNDFELNGKGQKLWVGRVFLLSRNRESLGENREAVLDEVILGQLPQGKNAPGAPNVIQIHGLLEIGQVVPLQLDVEGLQGGRVEKFGMLPGRDLAIALIDQPIELLRGKGSRLG